MNAYDLKLITNFGDDKEFDSLHEVISETIHGKVSNKNALFINYDEVSSIVIELTKRDDDTIVGEVYDSAINQKSVWLHTFFLQIGEIEATTLLIAILGIAYKQIALSYKESLYGSNS